MKVVFCISYYPEYLKAFYTKNPHLRSASYTAQHEALVNDFYGVWGPYTHYFNAMGHRAELIIPNNRHLQEAWAKEHGVKITRDWPFSIALEQVKKIKPDIFFIGSMFEYFGSFLDEIKKTVPHVFGWIACYIPPGTNIKQLDLILTSVPAFVDDFRTKGVNSELLSAAFDARVLTHIEPSLKQDIDFSFIGSFTSAHSKRISIIKELAERTPLTIFGTGINKIPDERNLLRKLSSKSLIQQRYGGETWGLEMFRTLHRSRITFNSHIDISGNFAGNMRMFEATGAGTLLLTDGIHSSKKLFTDDEVVYYSSLDDAVEKVNYFLDHEDERKLIAEKGQLKTLSYYNFENTSRAMHDYFIRYMPGTVPVKNNFSQETA
ncbi:MAG: hypothetical protein EPN92_00805 [Chitinophagaceae bacterium]|nr:MAG: hypothetical protein EPN92_00805 [Chitinophagaceae bacterium]